MGTRYISAFFLPSMTLKCVKCAIVSKHLERLVDPVRLRSASVVAADERQWDRWQEDDFICNFSAGSCRVFGICLCFLWFVIVLLWSTFGLVAFESI